MIAASWCPCPTGCASFPRLEWGAPFGGLTDWGLVRDKRDHPGVLDPLGGKTLCFVSALCLCSVWESGAIAVLVLRTLRETALQEGERGG